MQEKQANLLPVPHSRRGGGARYDSHCKLPETQVTTLEALDIVKEKSFVPFVSRSDRVDCHRIRDRELTNPRDVLLHTRPDRVGVDRAVLLLICHLGKLAFSGFEENVDCSGVCSVVFHNRSSIAEFR